MANICILTTAHSPDDDRIYHREAVSLARAGHAVTIIAPWKGNALSPVGVRLVGVHRMHGRLSRMLLSACQVFQMALKQAAHVYHFHDPELLPWMMVAARYGRQVIYDVHEYYAHSTLTKAWLPPVARPAVAGALKRLENTASRRFAGIVTVNEHMADLFREVNARVVSVGNYPPSWFLNMCRRPTRPIEGRITYVGALNRERGCALIQAAMPLVRKQVPNASCLILGPVDCAGFDDEYAHLDQAGPAGAINWQGIVEFAEVPAYLSRAQVCWLPWQCTPNNDRGTPAKLFEYMSAGRPVVASRLGRVGPMIEETRCGIVVAPLNAQAHADAICYLLNHPQEAAAMGTRGRRAVEERYNWETEERKLLNLYERVLSGT
jgi:glycosyltransferase involved in cell wall biosynthesis